MRNILFASALILSLCFPKITAQIHSTRGDQQTYKLNIAAQHILFSYVDSVDKNKLIENAITGMLKDLDPHSKYLTPDEVKQSREQLQGNFKGIGIEFNIMDDTLNVVRVIEKGPSQKAGLKPGDKIIVINEDTIAGIGLTNNYVFKNLRGPKGSKVDLKIKRRNTTQLLSFSIIRDNIPLYSIQSTFMATDDIGYIRISRFGGTTHNEFLKALSQLKKQGMKKLILDLQGNGGGYLSAAIQIGNQFLKKNSLIVYTEGLNSRRKDYTALSKGTLNKTELAVLVDESSASASEIFAGAIQDWDRGVIIGRRTFGKGLVQRPFNLPDGSELRLTISKYYTPTGRSIQKPYTNGSKEYSNELDERLKSGELFDGHAYHFPDSLKYYTLKNKRVVYGGGGIMPDVFVPLDTTLFSEFHKKIISAGIMNRFAFDYVDKHRSRIQNNYKEFDNFLNHFEVSDSLFETLTFEAKQEQISDSTLNENNKSFLMLQLKGLFARYAYGPSYYFEVTKQNEPAFKTAIDILSSEKKYESYLEN